MLVVSVVSGLALHFIVRTIMRMHAKRIKGAHRNLPAALYLNQPRTDEHVEINIARSWKHVCSFARTTQT